MFYDFRKIEKKWQKHWQDHKSFKTLNDESLPKIYILDMFPYPSAEGLHVGHIEGYAASDIYARFKRMQGYNVLVPMGFDAFGLPAEQYAIKTGNDPKEFTYQNIENFKRQIIESGKGIDWDRQVITSDPSYYKWTQWIFTKLYEHGLAEIKEVEVNWCEELGTVLANDEIEVVDGLMVSERGGYPVTKKAMKQWVLKITKYAERLLNDLELLDWSDSLKEMQRNWIGKSTGATITFEVANSDESFDIFTTRPDTLYGVSYCVLAPEHPLVLEITSPSEYDEVKSYIELTKQKSDLDRELDKEKTGVFIGAFAIHPLTGVQLPIWISDYVLTSYGTGAVMAVPAHDERDYEFAIKFGLDIIQVIDSDVVGEAYTGDGIHINSPLFNGLNIKEANEVIIRYLETNKLGYKTDNYKLRDWVFSRQRYWGEPFPVLFGEDGEIKVLKEEELPLLLPKLDNIKPSGTGESPLANALDWLYVEIDGKKYRRETNTMPQLAGSSWYYIGYLLQSENGMIPLNSLEAKEEIQKWLPVDLYLGGKEHAVGHLLYARFWHKFLYDIGLVQSPEPFKKLVNQGMILGDNGQKMSKSLGNVVNPDDIIHSHGADSLRLYEMFMGPLESDKPWSTTSLDGAKRFLDRVYRMYKQFEITENNVNELDYVYHQTVKKVTEDFETLAFNTAISQMMIFVNEVYKVEKIDRKKAINFLKLLNPVAPHLTEEINQVILNNEEELLYSKWPDFDPQMIILAEVEMVFQVNGRVRAKLQVPRDLPEAELKQIAFGLDNIKTHLEGLNVLKVIIIPNKLINIVAK
ncbi:MAG: leucine--tRNA ligase [Acholeplasmataceae bacterium]